MKRITSIAFLAMAVVLTVASAFAQGYAVQASIPFNFRVGSTWLPAGNYRIVPQSTHVILVRNQDHQKYAVFSLINPTDDPSSKAARLTFHRYGDQYFLNQIACGSCSMNVELPVSKVEKRAMNTEAGLRHSDQVFLALK